MIYLAFLRTVSIRRFNLQAVAALLNGCDAEKGIQLQTQWKRLFFNWL